MWPFTRKKKEDKVTEVKQEKPSNVRVYPRPGISADMINKSNSAKYFSKSSGGGFSV